MNNQYWLSWECPLLDYSPLTYPPVEGILGWWCSGQSGNGGWTLCAAVVANDEEAAWAIIVADWPEATTERRRFIQVKVGRPGDRFPILPGSWSEKRFDAVSKETDNG